MFIHTMSKVIAFKGKWGQKKINNNPALFFCMKSGLKALVKMPQERILFNLFEAFLFTLLYFSIVKRRGHLETKNS